MAMHMTTRNPRGVALVTVFMIMALLVAMTIALLQIAVSNTGVADNNRNRMQALLLAQAGISAAMNELRLGKSLNSGTVGNMTVSWGYQQSYTVTTTDNHDTTFTIVSIGKYAFDQNAGGIDTVQRKLTAIAQAPVLAGGFTSGAFGKATLSLSGIAHTDSYDSGLGTSYATQVAAAGGSANYQATVGNGGNVGSNGSISGTGSIIVHGNATPGPGNSVSLTGGAVITGSTAPGSTTQTFNSVTYAPPIPTSGSFSLSGNGVAALTAGTYRYSSWSQSGGNVTLSGTVNIYLDGDFSQSGQGQITLAPGAIVTLYQGISGSFKLAGQGVISPDTNPSHFNIVSASTSSVNVTGQGDLAVTVYAPDADVSLTGQGELFGAVVGKNVSLSGQGTFHYDKSATSPGIKLGLILLSYWEVDM
jgi:Tfp pilus assembly protein PilX